MRGRGLIVMKIDKKNAPAWKKQHLGTDYFLGKFEKNSCLAKVF